MREHLYMVQMVVNKDNHFKGFIKARNDFCIEIKAKEFGFKLHGQSIQVWL